jgi:Transketolase, thiamine diphosphate binding domain
MSVTTPTTEKLAIDTIRTLSMDAVQAANSGHPGTPMALAPVAFQLWTSTLRYDPSKPLWANRDRFVLSCGHASMLLYSLLHLAGVKATDKHGSVLDRPRMTSRNSDSYTVPARATLSLVKRPGSKLPPDHSAKALPTALAWRWPQIGLPQPTIGRALNFSTTTSTLYVAMVT